VDKTIRVVKGATGMIKRINAAVVVNNSVTTNDKGKTTSTPLTDAQVEKMTALVREAVGFSKDRGDSVNLLNAAFAPEKVEVVDVPLWRQPDIQDLARSFAWPLGTLLFAGLVLMGVIRPAMKAMAQTPVPAPSAASNVRINQLDALESDTPERPQLAGPVGLKALPRSPLARCNWRMRAS
jgi:flagellar M-ring protein FliF